MTREYPERPLVGVGAVIVDGDRVLLVRRASEPLKGKWSLPGGLIEAGESSVDAIRREVREETGLEVRVESLVEAVDRVTRDDAGRVQYHYVILDYLCSVVGGTASAASDVSEVAWASEEQLAQYSLTGDTVRIIRQGMQQAASSSG